MGQPQQDPLRGDQAAAGPEGPGDGASASGVAWLLALPKAIARRLRDSAATSPGRLTMIGVGLVVLAMIAGIVGTIVAQDKRDVVTNLTDYREPLSSAAQQIYGSLSEADASAATAFLNGGIEPDSLRSSYELNIARAGAALSKATSDQGATSEADLMVKTLATQLPVYTGLVETARTYNRQGFPAGAAYLREASALMSEEILPAARKLYQIDSAELSEQQDEANAFPWVMAIFGIGLLVALIATQRYLTRRTNRVINKGLLVATIAVGIAVLWGTGAMLTQAILVNDGREHGSNQADVLSRARIAALEGRANETMTLVSRGEGDAFQKNFDAARKRLVGADGNGGLLAEARGLAEGAEHADDVRAATENAKLWLQRHQQMRKLDQEGDYEQAQQLAVGAEEQSVATAFRKLDESLQRGISAGRQEFRAGTVYGGRALLLLAPGMTLLALVAAGGVAVGIQERLREYR
ncbi:hypothetical protein EV191_12914 [Tamaricihabitans halophyticus]|uniref:Secreted protein n=1 Tax=Tamaricihabitans halophyticus TaxID=1262583 RepID=A0A4V2SQY2_9PSEU|nr:hypothetical protein [Tamaricihabitans halophyticus]TCP40676.1 hypothetical protein EV191_12914 [Tamaricihabitans halophyticus]